MNNKSVFKFLQIYLIISVLHYFFPSKVHINHMITGLLVTVIILLSMIVFEKTFISIHLIFKDKNTGFLFDMLLIAIFISTIFIVPISAFILTLVINGFSIHGFWMYTLLYLGCVNFTVRKKTDLKQK